MVTSPPLSPSPIKERGKNIKKRGFAPLKHSCFQGFKGEAFEGGRVGRKTT